MERSRVVPIKSRANWKWRGNSKLVTHTNKKDMERKKRKKSFGTGDLSVRQVTKGESHSHVLKKLK